MKTAIVWLRNDLRLIDHEALYRACEKAEHVLPVYIIDHEYLSREGYGFRKMGARRWRFICECLADLRAGYKACGADVIIAKGKPWEVIPALCEKYGATLVTAHKEVTWEEAEVENALRAALGKGVELKLYWGHTLYHVNDLPFPHQQLPDIFTEFRKKVEKSSKVRACFPAPEQLHLPEGINDFGAIPDEATIGLEPAPIDPRAAIAFRGGEEAAWKRLDHYFHESELLATYKDTRNGLLGIDYSSKFSAWLALGCISPRSIYFEVKRFEQEVKKNQSTYWLVFELIWRDYFRYVAMKFGNKLFHEGGIRNEPPSRYDDAARMEAWKEGRTGIPFVDANMRELHLTGFMSNRGRQNVASFLVKDLKQDWRRGAAWFEQQLIDYDVCSNWGNWAYVAGVGNDPREERYFNMLTQAARYDRDGAYVKHWIPELQAVDVHHIQAPWMLNKEVKKQLGIMNSVYDQPVLVPKSWKL